MEKRIGVSAGLASFSIGVVLALYEVQGWNMPAPLAVFFIFLLLLLIITAVGVILYEVLKAVLHYLQQRAVSAAWVSTEEPGLLDFEADALRGMERFTSQMKKLAKDTRRLGQALPKHQKRILNVSGNPYKKQKRANQAAKDIDQRAMFINQRRELLDVLFNEMHRNWIGLISEINFDQKEDIESARSLSGTLGHHVDTVKVMLISLSGYREATKELRDTNISRTIRVESNRLMEALDNMQDTLQRHSVNSQQVQDTLDNSIPLTN